MTWNVLPSRVMNSGDKKTRDEKAETMPPVTQTFLPHQ
jgi:hypothetical protein